MQSAYREAKNSMKRRPPKGNVRRVRHINGNHRTTFHTKTGRTVQCESHQEYRLAILLDRDKTVLDYNSQPKKLTYHLRNGGERTYVPDFVVWRADGTTELHEVTVEARRQSNPDQSQREKAASLICQERGWRYIVHTDKTLPQGSEWANLINMLGFRAEIYNNQTVRKHLEQHLITHGKSRLLDVVNESQSALSLPVGVINCTIQHLIWWGAIETDLCILLYIDASPNRQSKIWLGAPEDVR